jgi:hypothetical protein
VAYSIALNKALKFVPGLAAVHRTTLSGRRLALLIIISKIEPISSIMLDVIIGLRYYSGHDKILSR